ncbi:MAG: carboxypeptidase regulatory-like domain-containing protein [Anaerolineae bacterium]|nr:carboxypeptidase regulatory-like domain-containing protein [Anaerolineae bacterium]
MKPQKRWLWMSVLVLPLLVVGFLVAGAVPSLTKETAAQEPTTAVSLPAVAVAESASTGETSAPAAEPPARAAAAETPTPGAASGPPVSPTPPPVAVEGTCISGLVIDNLGVPQPGWTVTASHESGAPTHISTTDAYGRFSFTNLGAGTWFLEVTVPAGWKATTPSRFHVTLTGQGTACANVRFKNERLACVEIVKRDSNDGAGLPGWRITGQKGDQQVTAITDGLGKAKLENLEAGLWTLCEEIPPGWAAVYPANGCMTVNLAPPRWDGAPCVRLEFTNRQVARSYGFDVLKTDDKGNPLSGWRFHARPADHPGPDLVAITGVDGVARFRSGITLGVWTVSEESQEHWRPVGPATQQITITQPYWEGQFPRLEFVNEPTTCVLIKKIDENHNGLGGWTIRAEYLDDEEEPERVVTTDSKGEAILCDLPLGRWRFSEDIKPGWTPGTVPQFEVELTRQGRPYEEIRFKNQSEPICVEGYKRDENQVGLSGWVIRAKPVDSDGPVKVAITGADGYYRLDGLDARRWRFTEDLKLGWVPLNPAEGWVEVDLRSPGPGECVQVDFQNRSPRVCVDVWKKDVHGYAGLPDWEIRVTPDGGGETLTGRTDGTGFVRFADLMPGWYIVEEVMQDGWAPVSWTRRKVNLQPTADGSCTPVIFYNRQSRTPYIPPDPPSGNCRAVHVVAYGQTLSGIAWHYGVTVSQLMAANGLQNPNTIYAGQRLCIP